MEEEERRSVRRQGGQVKIFIWKETSDEGSVLCRGMAVAVADTIEEARGICVISGARSVEVARDPDVILDLDSINHAVAWVLSSGG